MMTLLYLLKQHNPALAGDAIKSHALSYFHIFNNRQDNIRATRDTDCSAIAGMNRITVRSEVTPEVMPITPARIPIWISAAPGRCGRAHPCCWRGLPHGDAVRRTARKAGQTPVTPGIIKNNNRITNSQ